MLGVGAAAVLETTATPLRTPEVEDAAAAPPVLAFDDPAVELTPDGDPPAAPEPLAEEPLAAEPVADEPFADEPFAEEPVAAELPESEEPLPEEPLAPEEAVAEEPLDPAELVAGQSSLWSVSSWALAVVSDVWLE